jgi:GMP synthase-like glutamine amidotransferase
MRLHWLQHVPFEGLGYIKDWAEEQGFDITCTRLYEGEELPKMDEFDWLIVMGGPMGIFDYNDHPWLTDEKEFIELAIDEEKTVIGICLGAQLIATALGAEVKNNPVKEIGWYDDLSNILDLISNRLAGKAAFKDGIERPDRTEPS